MKNVLFVMIAMMVLAAVGQAETTTVWNPAANTDPNAAPLWTVGANWTGGVAPMTQAGDWKVVFNVNNAAECTLDTVVTIWKLSMGDNSGEINGNKLRLVDGAFLTAGIAAAGNTDWTAIGYNRSSTLTIEAGASFETKNYIIIGRDGSNIAAPTVPQPSYVYINGGTMTVNGNCILGNGDADKTDGGGHIFVGDGGLLSVAALSVTNTAVGHSFIDVADGTVKVNGNVTGNVNTMIGDGRITAYQNANFDKPALVNYTFDSSNNKTVITATHPQEPAPLLHEVVPIGDVTFAWNNWDPNSAGASVVVDVWVGTDPNKMSLAYTKEVAAMDVTGQARSSVVINVPSKGTYYWQVDTDNGAFHEGDLFTFEATNNLPPEVDAGIGYMTWIGESVQLDATVTDENTPTLTWTYEPADGNVSFSDASVEDPIVTVNASGTYTLMLTANDGMNEAVSDTLVIRNYDNACAAARQGTGVIYATDLVVDCKINLDDLAEIANNWLVDYALAAPIAQ